MCIYKKNKVVSMAELSSVIIEMLESGCNIKLLVTGNSMYPLFRNRLDMVILTKKDRIKKYDIILYKRDDASYILHRVVKLVNGTYYCAGDNEETIEYPIYSDNVLACVKAFYRGNKYMLTSNLLYRFYSYVWVFILPYRQNVIRFLKQAQLTLNRLRRFCCGK